MHSKSLTLLTSLVATGLFAAGSAMAQEAAPAAPADAAAPAAEPAAEDEGSGVGLNLDLEVASAYVWRGLNIWGPDQDSQNVSVFPSATVSVSDFWAGYWGAYQLTGDTKGDNVDLGAGAEQDLYAGYDLGLTDELGLSFFGTFYFYPLAEGDMPMYIEPGVSASYSTVVDLGLGLMFFKGIGDVSDPYSHLYINPSVSKELELTPELSLGLGASFGYKIETHSDAITEDGNNWNVQADVGVTYAIDSLYISPAVHVAFTDIGSAAEELGVEKSEGLAYWGGVNVGYDFAF